jgi:hypothetical protein
VLAHETSKPLAGVTVIAAPVSPMPFCGPQIAQMQISSR